MITPKVRLKFLSPLARLKRGATSRKTGIHSPKDMPIKLRILAPTIALAWVCLASSCVASAAETWVDIDDTIYGAKPDQRGPIGGGEGFFDIMTQGDYHVTDLDSLLTALTQARPGQVVFIPAETEIDLTARIYIEQLVLEIPEGVTLAGERGHQGSQGALLTSDALKTPVMIRTLGPDVRITGLRIRGPNPKKYLDHHGRSFGSDRGREYYYKFPTSIGIQTEYTRLKVDNCEISAFGHSGIYLKNGEAHHIHHNFIHHCQYNGLGYGVCVDSATSIIEFNRFNWTRHAIAATGLPGSSYVARHNVVLEESLGHCFDVHGGRDRKDGTDIAGSAFEIHHNTFWSPQTPVVIRGVPQEGGEIHHNWFPKHLNAAQAVRASARTTTANNVYGMNPQTSK